MEEEKGDKKIIARTIQAVNLFLESLNTPRTAIKYLNSPEYSFSKLGRLEPAELF